MSRKARLSLLFVLAGAGLLVVWIAVLGPLPVHGAQAPLDRAVEPAGGPGLDATGAVTKTVYLPMIGRKLFSCFFDNFANPASNWYVGESEWSVMGYLNGEYQIRLKTGDGSAWGTPDLVLPADYHLEVDARLVTDNAGSYGLVFGGDWFGEDSGSYQFIVFPMAQMYLIERWDAAGNWTTLVPETVSPLINSGTATNRLRIDRIGSSIHAYINGVLVATFDDASMMRAGLDAGVRAYSYDEGAVDARFDNFEACATTLPDPLYVDDFSVGDRWFTADLGGAQFGYQGAEYEILVRNADYWSATGAPLGGGLPRFAVEVDARLATDTPGGYGILFGGIDWEHFYVFIVDSGSQYYGLWKNTPSGWATLVDWTYSSDINAGMDTNWLRVERDGAEINLYANDVWLTSASDSSYLGNLAVGLYAQSYDAAPVTVRYDNFVFRELP